MQKTVDNNENDISLIMKSINVSYAMYFNGKYGRVGHLFQDRFKSEIVKDDRYLLELSKYIHMNPVRANMVKSPGDYPWSSYNIYIGKTKDYYNLVDTSQVLDCFSDNRCNAIREYINYVNNTEHSEEWQIENVVSFMDVPDEKTIEKPPNEKEILALAYKFIKEKDLQPADVFSKYTPHVAIRNRFIRFLHQNTNLTLAEIGKLFGGLTHSSVSKILKSDRI